VLRVVLDTNVLVSAIISDGKSRQLLRKGIANQFTIITSDLILRELATVLRRPKFKTSEEEINRIILALGRVAQVVSVKSRFRVIKEDPKDNMIVETAYDGSADVIVSGDSHLLALQNFRGIKILTVQSMLELI
jgi:putative PIN family toxin of toxin-antitoxin system